MALPEHSGFNFHDHEADPSADGEINRNAEEIKAYLESAVQKLVLQRYPGVNPGVNLLRNPSFEVDANGETITGWTKFGGSAAVVSTAEAYDGSKSALLPVGDDDDTGILQTISVLKGQYIKISAACYASTADITRLRLSINGGEDDIYSDYHTGGGDWEILTAIYGPMTADGTVSIEMWKELDIETAIYYDHAVLEVSDTSFNHGKIWLEPGAASLTGCTLATKGTYSAIDMDAAAEVAYWSFPVPDTFVPEIATYEILYIANTTPGGVDDGLDIATNFGASGEAYNNHTDTDNGIETAAKTQNNLYRGDISSAFTSLAVNDICGISVTVPAVVAGAIDISLLGILITW